jgi:hypothetical protein
LRNKRLASSVGIGQRDKANAGMMRDWVEPKPSSKHNHKEALITALGLFCGPQGGVLGVSQG